MQEIDFIFKYNEQEIDFILKCNIQGIHFTLKRNIEETITQQFANVA